MGLSPYVSILSILLQAAQPDRVVPTAAVRGTVTDGQTGKPVADMIVSAPGATTGGAKTDLQGRFQIKGMTPGTTAIVVSGGHGYLGEGRRLTLLPGDDLTGADIKLLREASISGVVSNRNRTFAASAVVTVFSRGYQNGRPIWTSFHSQRTDSQGHYAIEGLLPGRYFLMVEPRPIQIRKGLPPRQKGVEPEPVLETVRTYFPNSPTIEGASQIFLGAGATASNVGLTLLLERTVCVASQLLDRTGTQPGSEINVLLAETFPMSQSRVAAGVFHSGDVFEVCGIPPGSYRLSAFGFSGDEIGRYAADQISITNRYVTASPLLLQPTAPLKGSITVEGAKGESQSLAGIRITLRPKDRAGMAGESTEVASDESGNFNFPAVIADDYWLGVHHLPDRHYVRSASTATQEAWLMPVNGGAGELRIALGSDGSALTGQVKDSAGRAASDCAVLIQREPLLIPAPPNQFYSSTTDQSGSFRFSNVPPGDYRVLAVPISSERELWNPEIMKRYERRTTAIAISGNQNFLPNLVLTVK